MLLKELLEEVDTTTPYHDERMKEFDVMLAQLSKTITKGSPESQKWKKEFDRVRNLNDKKSIQYSEYDDLMPLIRFGYELIKSAK